MKIILAGFLFLTALVLGISNSGYAEGPKFALIIGNGNYDELSKLSNPTNDATDIAEKLRSIGFQVELLTDADLPTMEEATLSLGNKLSTSKEAIGFFFYAGHGVQSNGINYIIPVDAHIPSENYLKTKALAAQEVLDTLQSANNDLNIVVLDACRDNPFGWARTGTRGLAVVGIQPPGSIIIYSTSAGSVASDGQGRNGLFTSELLRNIDAPNVEVKEVFNRTGKDVVTASNNKQVPAIYSQFFNTAYLNGTPGEIIDQLSDLSINPEPVIGQVMIKTGGIKVHVLTAGKMKFMENDIDLPAGAVLPITNVKPGHYDMTVKYSDGNTESRSIDVISNQTIDVAFTYKAPAKQVSDEKSQVTELKPATEPAANEVLSAPLTYTPGTAEYNKKVRQLKQDMEKGKITRAEYNQAVRRLKQEYLGSK
jgi:hypothetical protein